MNPAFGEKTMVEIFDIAIEREREAQELYRHAAEMAGPGTDLEKMFRSLEHEEREHEERLIEDYTQFKAKLGKP